MKDIFFKQITSASYGPYGHKLYGLTEDGRVYTFSEMENAWVPMPRTATK